MPEQFYLVWKENGGSPTRRHDDYVDARNEAERLARTHPNVKFYLCTAEEFCEHTQPVAWTKLDVPVPF